MFNKANVIVINKIDLAAASDVDLKELEANVRDVSPRATIFSLSCKTGVGFGNWTSWLEQAIRLHSAAALAIA